MDFGWILRGVIIFLLQQLIAGASLSNANLKPVQKEAFESEGVYKVSKRLQNYKNGKPSHKPDLAYVIPQKQHLHASKTNLPNQTVISRKFWSTEHKKLNYQQLKTDYDKKANMPHPLNPNDSNLKTSVDGYQVKVTSAHEKHKGNDFFNKNLDIGHEIEIFPVKSKKAHEFFDSTSNINLALKEQKRKDFNRLEFPGEISEHLLNKDSQTRISSTPSSVVEEKHDLIVEPEVDMEAEEQSLQGEKSGRLLDIFSRSNTSTCTTPSGETGRCRRLSECLLSDALSNFSLFLQYLCMLGGPFVGVCCPDNPVIETSDGESKDNTTIPELTQPKGGCGQNSNARIVGGTMSTPHEWTWMVALMRKNRFFCGGAIINDWYVLTAAHCVLGIKVKDLSVRLGEYNFMENNEHQMDLPVAEIKRHAQFVTLTFQHDVALLKLKRKVEYSKFIGSICLPAQNATDFTKVNATVVGWGTVSFGGAVSPVLRQVTIPVWSNKDCDKTYRLESITDSFMCAGSPENGEDACQGDSGGPLMALNSNRRWEVIGIVSWGRRCGDPTYPGVYTRVATYANWIAENMQ